MLKTNKNKKEEKIRTRYYKNSRANYLPSHYSSGDNGRALFAWRCNILQIASRLDFNFSSHLFCFSLLTPSTSPSPLSGQSGFGRVLNQEGEVSDGCKTQCGDWVIWENASVTILHVFLFWPCEKIHLILDFHWGCWTTWSAGSSCS